MQEKKLSDLRVKRIVVNKIDMVKAYGKCDVYSAPLLKDAMAEVISEGCKKLIVDVKDLLYIDNSGIAAILWARHKIEENGGIIVVIGLKNGYGRMLNLLDNLLNSARSVKEALVVLNRAS